MKVKIIRTTFASGKLVEFDKVVDLSEEDAQTLLRLGRAVPYEEEPAAKKKAAKKKAK